MTAQVITYRDDFSQDVLGQPPIDWDQFGSKRITPTVEEISSQGGVDRDIAFPRLPSGNTDLWLINNKITCAQATATVRLTFWDSTADSAGLVLAWGDENDQIRVVPNVYWQFLGFHEWVHGAWKTRIETPRGSLPIRPGVPYWLRVITAIDQHGGRSATVLWSTDGATFHEVTSVPNMANIAGRVGLETSGVNLPQTTFSDFSVTGNCTMIASPAAGRAGASRALGGAPVLQGDAGRGKTLFLGIGGCAACHAIAGTTAAGAIGPDLTHVGARLSVDQIATELSDPHQRPAPYATPLQVGGSMPSNNLTSQERADITTWLAQQE